MSNTSRPAETRSAGASAETRKDVADLCQTAAPQKAESKSRRARYADMQSAVRFPIHLPVRVKSKAGESRAETQNISANGVLFQMDSEMPVGSMVDFTISLPADVVGAEVDVQLDCRGRVVRNAQSGSRRGVGVVIDEYHFERR